MMSSVHVVALVGVLLCLGPLYASADQPLSRLGSADAHLPLEEIPPQVEAVAFQQVTFEFQAGTITGTDWGQFQADPARLRVLTSRHAGYINVFIHSEEQTGVPSWVVENLRIIAPVEQRSGPRDKARSAEEEQPLVEPTPVPDLSAQEVPRRQPYMSIYFDLRPGIEGQGSVDRVLATVLFSEQPLPPVQDIATLAAGFRPHWFEVQQVIHNAEGYLSEAAVDTAPPPVLTAETFGPPPQATIPSLAEPTLVVPLEIVQLASPNVDATINQCVPMAFANVLQYLEDRYNMPLVTPPLSWIIPEEHVRGVGRQFVTVWNPIPNDSLVANIDALTMRQGATGVDVFDVENSHGTDSLCQGVQGLFGYLAAKDLGNQVVFRHQGPKDDYTERLGPQCPMAAPAIDPERFVSTGEGTTPTWEWIFDQLQLGRGVALGFGRYSTNGFRTGGHMVRVWRAARNLYNKHYLNVLDDNDQGDNTDGTDAPREWEVADIGQPALRGLPDGQLNIQGLLSLEIEFALSIEAIPLPPVP